MEDMVYLLIRYDDYTDGQSYCVDSASSLAGCFHSLAEAESAKLSAEQDADLDGPGFRIIAAKFGLLDKAIEIDRTWYYE